MPFLPFLRSTVVCGAAVLVCFKAAPSFASADKGRANAQPSDPISAKAGEGRTLLLLAANGLLRDGNYTGPAIDTYYGWLQVRADIQSGRLIRVEVLQYPNDRRASIRINSRALPWLESEVIQAQSAHVNGVTGATLSSEAYLRSLDGALNSAGAV